MNKVIILFGKPGAGKGTRLSEFLRERENEYDVLSVGNLLRKARKEQTELGKRASSYMDAGQLVPDDIINAIVIDGLKNTEKPIFTDGFPRTIAQAEAMLQAGIYPAIVIEFLVDDEVIIERSRHRVVCSCGESYALNGFKLPKVEGICDKCGGNLFRRADDEEDVVRRRLEVYQNETYPVKQVLADAGINIEIVDNSDSKGASTKFESLMKSL